MSVVLISGQVVVYSITWLLLPVCLTRLVVSIFEPVDFRFRSHEAFGRCNGRVSIIALGFFLLLLRVFSSVLSEVR